MAAIFSDPFLMPPTALNLSSARVRLLAANGGLPAAKVGGRWLVERSGLEQRRAARVAVGGVGSSPANAWAVLAPGFRGSGGSSIDPAHSLPPSQAAVARGPCGPGASTASAGPRCVATRATPGEIAHLLADQATCRVGSPVRPGRIDLDLDGPDEEADGYMLCLGPRCDLSASMPCRRRPKSVSPMSTLRVVSDDVWAEFVGGSASTPPEAAVALDLGARMPIRGREPPARGSSTGSTRAAR